MRDVKDIKASRAALLLLLVSIVWGSGFGVSSICLDEGLSPEWLLAGRFIFASIMMDIMFIKAIKELDKKTVISGVVIGVILFAAFTFQNYGLLNSTPSVCAFVTSVYVVLIPLFNWAKTKKRPETSALIASAMAMIGVALFSISGGTGGIGGTGVVETTEALTVSFGALLTLGAAVLYAFQVLGIERYTKKHSPLALTIVMINFTAVISLLAALMTWSREPPVFTAKGIYSLIYLGVFCTALCFLGQTVGQKYTSASKAGIIMSLEAVFGSIFSAVILNEVFTVRMVIGAIIIFAAVVISEKGKVSGDCLAIPPVEDK